jgi:hypothetical protein
VWPGLSGAVPFDGSGVGTVSDACPGDVRPLRVRWAPSGTRRG